MGYIAHTGEGFISRPGDATGETAYRSWVGVSPRLSIRDAASGYAQVENDPSYNTWVVAYLAPFTPVTPLLVDTQVRFTGTFSEFPTGNVVTLGIDNENGIYVAADAVNISYGLPVGSWYDATLELEPRDDAEFAAAAAAGEVFIAFALILSAGESYDLSFLGLRGGARPLRWRQRNDGLGGSSPRAARGVTSQQGSSRHRGYL